MYTVTITEKGQIVIPAKIRKKFRLKKGTKLFVEAEGIGILIRPETNGYIKSIEGYMGRGGKVTEFLLHEHEAERKADDKKWKR